jgi:cysteinyl-tRNA synthetase
VRYALMRVHYRAQLNFTWEGMEESRKALRRVDAWVARLREKAEEENAQRPTPNVQRPTEEGSGFEDALDDDLNISGALGVLFETISETNLALDLGKLDSDAARLRLQWWERTDRVLAVSGEKTVALPAEIAALAEARTQARLAKEWRKSDELRDELAAKGWEVRDTKDGQRITRRGGV